MVLTDLKHEIESLWSPYGVRVEWTDVRAGETATRGLSVEAILEPRIGKERNEPKWTPVLGRAFVNLTAPATRPIRVSFEATEELFALRTTSGASIATIVHDGELARALGRVLAHEIGHVLLGAPYHDEAGLMRRLFYPSELAAPDRAPFRLTCLGIGRLRGRIRAMAGYEPEAIDPGICVPGHIVR